MHVGTFTQEGAWAAAERELAELARIGVTVLEIMPVAEFHGQFGWGYDGVLPFAPTHLYGGPDEFRRFVDCAHAIGLGVILDVVYNHFGICDNTISTSSPITTNRSGTTTNGPTRLTSMATNAARCENSSSPMPDIGSRNFTSTAIASTPRSRFYFHALQRYLDYTDDWNTVRDLLPTLRGIVDHHIRGTRFGIRVDPRDDLLI